MLRLALPIIQAELGWMSMGLVDTLMVSPLPRNKRAKHPNPRTDEGGDSANGDVAIPSDGPKSPGTAAAIKAPTPPAAFSNNPFAKLDVTPRSDGQNKS